MQGIPDADFNFSFKSLFIPLTTSKAITWIIILGFIVYANTLFNGFVSDDNSQIVDNTIIHSLVNLPLFFTGSSFNTGGAGVLAGAYYKPLMLTYFSFLFTFFGPNPFIFHLCQIIFAIANSCLVFFLFKNFFSKSFSLILSIVFLIHPINQETVAFISDSQDILFFFFGMLALLFTIKDRHNLKKIIAINALLICSLLSKETGILFICIVLLYQYLFKNKKTLSTFFSSGFLLIVYLIIRFTFIQFAGGNNATIPIMKISLLQRLENIPAIIFYYLEALFYPFRLAFNQQWVITSINFQNFYFPFFVDLLFFTFICLIGRYIYYKKKDNFSIYLFFLLWFLLGLLFHLQVVPLDATADDRWFYFPLVGLLGIVGVGIQSIEFSFKKNSTFIYYFIAVILLLLSFLTIRENTYWSNDLTLYTHYTNISDNFVLENNLGNALLDKGDFKNALVHLQESVNEKPYWSNLYSIGAVYYEEGVDAKAIYYWRKSLENGDYYLAYENLSYLFLIDNDTKNAKIYTEKGLHKLPYNAGLWYLYGLEEYKLRNKDNSIAAIQYAIHLDNTHSEWVTTLNQIINNQKINYQP